MALFFRRNPKRKPPAKPTWLKWLLLVFIGYALLMMNLPGNRASKSFEQAKSEIKGNADVNFGDYKNTLFPESAASMRISDVEEGKGAPAVCGQKVKLAYESFLAQGNALPDKAAKENPLAFTIGGGQSMPVFDKGVIGMKAGGKRSILAPPLMSYGLEDYKRSDVPEGANVRFEMELLSVEPVLPDVDAMPYRIAEVAVGKGLQLVCGEKVAVQIKIWDTSGKLLYENKDKEQLGFTPGKSEVMLGLEQGVIGMHEGGYRLLIIPPAYLRTMSGNAPKISLPLPKDQVVLIEVAALELPNP